GRHRGDRPGDRRVDDAEQLVAAERQGQGPGESQQFQGRYILRHAAQGDLSCEAGRQYQRDLVRRHTQEAQTLANLTGWDLGEIREKQPTIDINVTDPEPTPWWRNFWHNFRSSLTFWQA
ncbi:MAG: hypothetical protein ACO4AI_02870, partial [Prochlorothrix sp.]